MNLDFQICKCFCPEDFNYKVCKNYISVIFFQGFDLNQAYVAAQGKFCYQIKLNYYYEIVIEDCIEILRVEMYT